MSNNDLGFLVMLLAVVIGFFLGFIYGYEHGKDEKEQKIKALGRELRWVRKGIKDPKVVIGYNIAVSVCNKYLGGKE